MDLDAPLRGLELAVIDTETTGLDPARDRVLEVAVVHVAIGHGNPRVAFRSLIRPPGPIDPAATVVNGITDADVADAPAFGDIGSALLEAIGPKRVVCAFNAPFDFAFLVEEFARLARAEAFAAGAERLDEAIPLFERGSVRCVPTPPDAIAWPWLDAFVLGGLVDRYQRGKSLAEVAARRGYHLAAHGARGDSVAAALLVTTLLRECWRQRLLQVSTLGALLFWQRGAALEREREVVEFMARTGKHGRRPECPWHDIEGVTPPEWGVPGVAPVQCSVCRVPIRMDIRKDGSIEVVDATGAQHRHEEAG